MPYSEGYGGMSGDYGKNDKHYGKPWPFATNPKQKKDAASSKDGTNAKNHHEMYGTGNKNAKDY